MHADFSAEREGIRWHKCLHSDALASGQPLTLYANQFDQALVVLRRTETKAGRSAQIGELIRRKAVRALDARVFATNESMVWATMLLSMTLAGIASQHYDPRLIGAVSGVLSSMTALFWGWAVVTDRLPDPALKPASS